MCPCSECDCDYEIKNLRTEVRELESRLDRLITHLTQALDRISWQDGHGFLRQVAEDLSEI